MPLLSLIKAGVLLIEEETWRSLRSRRQPFRCPTVTHLLLLLQFVPDLHFTSGEAFSQRQHRHTPSFPTTYAAITRWAADSSMGVARVACLLVPLVASSLLSLVSPALAEAGTGPADAVPPQDKHRILSENLFLEAATKLAKQHKRVDAEWWERLDDEAAGETSLLFATPMFRSNLHLKYAPEEVKVRTAMQRRGCAGGLQPTAVAKKPSASNTLFTTTAFPPDSRLTFFRPLLTVAGYQRQAFGCHPGALHGERQGLRWRRRQRLGCSKGGGGGRRRCV